MRAAKSRILSALGYPCHPAYAAAVERLRIGELLVQAKLLTQERLDDALTLQRAQGRKLGQVLIELGIVNETQLTQTLGLQLSVPWVSLYHIDFSRQLLNLVPREIAERYCLVPIFVRRVRKQGETLYVAMDDPTHEAALEAVRGSSSLPVRPMIAAPSDIRSAIRVYYATGEPEAAPADAAEVPVPLTTVKTAGNPPPLPARPPPPPPPSPAVTAAPPPETIPPESVMPASEEEPPVPSEPPPSQDSPGAWPEVEARTMELPRRKGSPRMVALTLLDGTTIQLPAKPRRRRDEADADSPASPKFLANMTARDLIKALGAVAEGGDAREVFGERVPIEAICATLLSLLLRKGVIADWEFVEELKKR
jgi:type IV pilus assembly protein PilB